MIGVGLKNGSASHVEHERAISSIHFHPLEPHLRDEPVAQFIMSTYGVSFEEASLLVSMNDIHHSLSVYAQGNSVAEKMGLPAFNTFETVAGTVLLDENRNTVLAGLLPISRIPKSELDQLQKASAAGLNEQAYMGMTQETMRKFFDIVVDFTITEDRQASFLFEDGGITHLIAPRFVVGILDPDLTKVLRTEGGLEGTPLLSYGRDRRGAICAVITATYCTRNGSSFGRSYALPLEVIYPNQRILDALRAFSREAEGPVAFQSFAPAIGRLLDGNRQSLRPLQIGDRVLDVLPPELMPSDGGDQAPTKVGCIGARHSFHMAESLVAYAMSRNTITMKKAPADGSAN